MILTPAQATTFHTAMRHLHSFARAHGLHQEVAQC